MAFLKTIPISLKANGRMTRYLFASSFFLKCGFMSAKLNFSLQRSGPGVVTSKNGHYKYEGNWNDDRMDGEGSVASGFSESFTDLCSKVFSHLEV
jgi:hypothetical protein